MREGYFNDNDSGDGNKETTDNDQKEQNLLRIHQSKWQQQLLARYGNTISLIDATKLLDLDTELKRLVQEFRAGLPQEEQLIFQPATISRAVVKKRKYARIKSKLSCSKVPTQNPRGGKRQTQSFVTELELRPTVYGRYKKYTFTK